MALAGRLLVMQPVLNLVFTRRSASTISGRRSPDSSGSTSLPRTAAPSRRDSAANSRSKASRSTSARSNFAQAFSRVLAALVRRMMSAGSPRAASNRAKASNGEVVSTPPKSQITASIIVPTAMNAFASRLEERRIVERLDHGVDHVGGAVVLAFFQQLPHLAQIGADRRLQRRLALDQGARD